MDLLGMLTGSMTSEQSVDALAQKTGASSGLTSALISAALPILLGSLTNNASSQSGAQSLLGALTQHTDTAPMAQQLETADAQDGAAIIQHILGGNTPSVVSALSDQTGASTSQVQSLLNNMAPAMMSGVSAANTSAAQATAESPMDLGSLMGAFGGNESAAASENDMLNSLLGGGSLPGMGNLFGGMFGGGSSQADANAFNGNSLMSLLGGFMK